MRTFAWVLVVAGLLIAPSYTVYAAHESKRLDDLWWQRVKSAPRYDLATRYDWERHARWQAEGAIWTVVSPWPGVLTGIGVAAFGMLLLAIRRPGPRGVAAVGLALLLAGCATTLPEFRRDAPVQSGAVSGEYLPLATCTLFGLEHDEVLVGIGTTFSFADDAPGRWASVLGRMLKPDGLIAIPSPVVEVVFRETAAQQVRVAVRAESVGWPERAAWLPAHSAAEIVRRAEAAIARCAGAPVALMPAR